MRFFATEGPVRPDDHYSLPPLSRWNLDAILTLIDRSGSKTLGGDYRGDDAWFRLKSRLPSARFRRSPT